MLILRKEIMWDIFERQFLLKQFVWGETPQTPIELLLPLLVMPRNAHKVSSRGLDGGPP